MGTHKVKKVPIGTWSQKYGPFSEQWRKWRRKRKRMRIEWLSVPVCQRKVLAAKSVSNKSGFIKTEDLKTHSEAGI